MGCAHVNTVLREAERGTLVSQGWVILNADVDLLDLANQVGAPVASRRGGEIVEQLRPRSTEDAPRRSLSAAHGLGPFPLHTDGAHHAVPPRYVLLRATTPSSCATTLIDSHQIDWQPEEREILSRGVLAVTGGAHGFLTTILTSTWFRFDEGCMKPANATGLHALELTRGRISSGALKLPWAPGMTLLLDNWRCLHGRDATAAEPDRRLTRILVS